MKSSFADRMQQAFEESSYDSQIALADDAGTTKGQVNQWLKGRVNPKMVKADVLESISQALGVRPRWLLYGEDPMREGGRSEVREPPRAWRTWQAFDRASSATQAAVELLLLPPRDRATCIKGRNDLTLAVALLEQQAIEAINARKSPRAVAN